MKNIDFEIGSYREYVLNGNSSNPLKLDISDVGLIERLKKGMTEIDEYQKELDNVESPGEDIFEQMDKKAREIVNKIFDCDVCTKAFGNKNCFSLASNGKNNLTNFLEAFMPVLLEDFGETANALKSKLESKTEKYIAPVISKAPVETALPDVSALTPEQKMALAAQLIC